MFRLLALITLCLSLSSIALGQEICDNGTDDDSDGMIDLNDPDCSCYDIAANTLEGDFEEFSCCPTGFTTGAGNGIECLEVWSQASVASTDYMNTCDFVGGTGVPEVPMPIPSGNGAVGFITQSGWSEHVGICMPFSMIAGEEYTIEMWVGFNDSFVWPSNSPFTVGIYGTTDCDNYPSSGSSCMTFEADWYELGTQEVTGADDSWTLTSFTFVPTEDIEAIAIGGACSELGGPSEYHFIDGVVITGNFGGEPVNVGNIDVTGDCVSGVEVSIPEIPGSTYQWYLNGVAIDGATSSTYNVPGDGSGEYTVLVTNSLGCGTSGPETVDVDADVLDIDGDVTNVDCNGNANGSIDLDLPSDNPPLIIQWSSGQSTGEITDLPPGSYTVTVTDANGCFGTATFEITEPASVLAGEIVNVEQPIGGDGDGTAEVEATGGTPAYTYLWDNGETTPEATMLEPGTHSVTITDANGCETVLEVTIYEPLVIEAEVTDALCFGDCNGQIELTIMGGLTTYNIDWDNGGNAPINMNLCTGIYLVTVTDMAGTEVILNYEVTSPEEIVIVGDFPDAVCDDETSFIEVEMFGGTPDYTFIWSHGQTTQSVYDLVLDQYSVTVTDAAGCTATEDFLLQFFDPIEVDADIVQESCGGGADGAIQTIITNGNAPFQYEWSNGIMNADYIDGLISGMYTVTVTDVFGCSAVETFVVSQGGDLDVAISPTDASCPGTADGSIDLEVQGGVPPYTYMWDNGESTQDITGLVAGDYVITIEDNGGCVWINVITIDSGDGLEYTVDVFDASCWGADDGSVHFDMTSGTQPFVFNWSNGRDGPNESDLPPGSYDVMITDANGCSTDTTLVIASPPEIELSGNTTPVSCAGMMDGSVTIQVNGGVMPYDYLWSNGGIFQNLDQVGSGNHTVTVTDDNGCTAEATFTIDALDALQVSGAVVNASCNGGSDGSIDVTVSGGTSPYTYQWSTGSTDEDLAGLAQGAYELTVTDVNGCLQIIEFQVSGAGSILVNNVVTGILCNGDTDGSIDITPSGGTPPYDFLWSNGATDEDLTGVGAGVYSVTLTDSQGCEHISNYAIPDVPALGLSAMIVDIDCHGDMTGSVALTPSGGTPPYRFMWEDGSDGSVLSDVPVGTYGVTVTDDNGCTRVEQFDIVEPPLLEATITNVTNPTMAGEFGTADVVVTGGTGPYDILWGNGESGTSATQLGIGITTVTITDANGCVVELEVEIKVEAFNVDYDILQNACFGECFGEISLTMAGGLPPFSVEWSDGQTDATAVDLCNGFYSATITDSQGEQVVLDALEIISPPDLVLNADITELSCIGTSDASIDALVSGGTEPYVYSWDNGSMMSSLTGIPSGSYVLTVTDLHGCRVSDTYEVPDIEPIDVELNKTDITCINPQGEIVILGDNPDGYQYLINGDPVIGTNDPVISGLAPGDYLLEYEINDNCIIEIGSVSIEELSNFSISINPVGATLTAGESVTFSVEITGITGNISIVWEAGAPYECLSEDAEGNCLEILISPENTDEVTVTVSDDLGCMDAATALVNIERNRNVYVPNVFSPNGDTRNDIFKPTAADDGMFINSFRIFNRWGEEIYIEDSKDINALIGWNGEFKGILMNPGVYVYSLEVVHSDNFEEVIYGDVTLVR